MKRFGSYFLCLFSNKENELIYYFQDTCKACLMIGSPLVLIPDFILFSQTAIHFPTFISCTERLTCSPWLLIMLKFAPLGSRLMERCSKTRASALAIT